MSLLEVQNVHFSYKLNEQPVPILNGLSFKIQEGDLVAICGPSGSGKSTLLYILGCLLRLQKGKVFFEGEDTSKLSNERLAILRNRNIGFVFQQFHLLPRANVVENILLPTFYPAELSRQNPEDRERAIALATELGLGDRLNHIPNQLSGGQQQRVAIARALIRDPQVILADEPTGNLDTTTSAQIISILSEVNRRGKTVVIITHDLEIAKQCSRVLHLRDGMLVSEEKSRSAPKASADFRVEEISQTRSKKIKLSLKTKIASYFRLASQLLPIAGENLLRNKVRSALTMLGIVIGVSAVLAMITLGQFTKKKILESYADLGINTLTLHGYRNWELKATDQFPVMFTYFDWERDILPLKRIFPQIEYLSPQMDGWDSQVTYGGRVVDTDVRVVAVNSEGLPISNRELLMGHNFSPYQIELRSPVCILGHDIATRLFQNESPIDEIVNISEQNGQYGCRVIGVMKTLNTTNEWMRANTQVVLPFTFFQSVTSQRWNTFLRYVLIRVKDGTDVEAMAKAIKYFFERKYGKSGKFGVNSDSILVAQMRKFLTLFTIMLGTIAIISLAIGGIGITNMMLVSVSERLKEIGIRKAVGATDHSIKLQFLLESVTLCSFAGILGLLLGFFTYEMIIYGASKLVPKLQFVWVVDTGAVFLSLISILLVGILSGLIPAWRAERLQVIDALRTE